MTSNAMLPTSAVQEFRFLTKLGGGMEMQVPSLSSDWRRSNAKIFVTGRIYLLRGQSHLTLGMLRRSHIWPDRESAVLHRTSVVPVHTIARTSTPFHSASPSLAAAAVGSPARFVVDTPPEASAV